MPTNMQWNNFPDCLYRCHAAYCGLQGLSRTADEARDALYFMFYGTYMWSTRNNKKMLVTRIKPFIFWLHKKMVGGRSRFAQKVPTHFSKMIQLFEKNKEWTPYLTDLGKSKAPMEYLVAFELGMREYSSSVHSLGTRPLRSRKAWSQVAKWRKREAYIALARYLLRADTGYKQWDCFRFADYTTRSVMGKTFERRHLPLSNGKDDENFGGTLKFDWDKHAYVAKKRVKSEPGEYKHEEVKQTTAADDKPMVFDVELGKLVPVE